MKNLEIHRRPGVNGDPAGQVVPGALSDAGGKLLLLEMTNADGLPAYVKQNSAVVESMQSARATLPVACSFGSTVCLHATAELKSVDIYRAMKAAVEETGATHVVVVAPSMVLANRIDQGPKGGGNDKEYGVRHYVSGGSLRVAYSLVWPGADSPMPMNMLDTRKIGQGASVPFMLDAPVN